jgi:hypothetical protein
LTDGTQIDLFAPVSPAERKRLALQRALRGVAGEYQIKFLNAVYRRALTKRPFTSEDIIFDVGLPNDDVGVNRNNAVGALMNLAATCGLIKKTGRMVKSQRERSNGSLITEWVGAM